MPPAAGPTTSHPSASDDRFPSAKLLDLAPVGHFLLGHDGRIRSGNPEAARLLGLNQAELIGVDFAGLADAAGAGAFRAYLHQVQGGQQAKACEFEIASEGQTLRTLWIKAAAVAGAQECIVVAVDITRQKQVERALRESERRFRDVAAISADWIWEVDVEGRYTYASESVRTLLGYAPEDIIGKTAFDLMPPEEAARVGEIFGAIAMRGESFRDLENLVLDSQGGRHDTLTNGTPIRDAEGRVIGYRGVDRDVTRQRRAEAALKASRQRFHDLVDTTDGIVWEADAQTFDFTFVSKQAERLLGYPVEDWLRPGFWVEHLHPEDRGWAAEYCQACTRRLEGHEFEYRFITREGRTIWLHDLVAVVAEDGAPRWLRGIMVDVTRRRNAEEKLRDLAEELESKVEERTEQLRHISAQLTMTEERERRMLAESLHDNLGQLLAVIKIKLTSLPEEQQGTALREVVDLVERADREARSITLQLSPPVLRALGLAAALEWLAEDMKRVHGLTVHVDMDRCGKRLIDEMQAVLYRAARELLVNVAKHAGVASACLNCLCDGHRLLLVVSDAGRGFDPARHFGNWPGHNSFGLRSIYERISNLGGEVDIDSSPGSGTTVTISIPRVIGEEEICSDPSNACR